MTDQQKNACLHYSHELKNRAHKLFNVEFKKGSQLAIYKGLIDYAESNKDLALKLSQHIQLFMPKTQSATTKATKSLSKQSIGATEKELKAQQIEILNAMKASNPALYAIMKTGLKTD